MSDTLLQAYLPLFVWTGLGFLLCRLLPETLPRLLGRGLYWVGVPLEIFALARQSDFSAAIGIAPLVTAIALGAGLGLTWCSLLVLRWRSPEPESPELPLPFLSSTSWHDRPRSGSFFLSSVLGNTGFVGLAVIPAFVDAPHFSWLVIYSVVNNLIGTYGVGVWISSWFGQATTVKNGWAQVRDVLLVPSLWAFAIGFGSRLVALPPLVESGIAASVWVVIPTALLLMGMRISQLQGWQSLQLAIVPALLKTIAMPIGVGIASTLLGLSGEARLALVMMAGMPTAFAGLILAEEYELDRELIASSIVLSIGLLFLTIPVWLLIF